MAFRWNWDLVDARVDLSDPPPFDLSLEDLVAEMRDICATPTPPGDTQEAFLEEIAELADQMGGDALLPALRGLDDAAAKLSSRKQRGSKAKWRDHGGDDALESVTSAPANVKPLEQADWQGMAP